jgi:hypothetical protein
MAILSAECKHNLSALLAKGHAKFGKVAPRRPYREDEEGEGAPGFTVETHPWLADVPVGAASDLTFIASENSQITEEALDRVDELTPELQKQPRLQAELSYRHNHRYTPKPTPY